MTRTIISIVKDKSPVEMVARALEEIEFDELLEVRGGKFVVVKPNFADVSRIAPLDFPDGEKYRKRGINSSNFGLPRRGDQTSTEVVEALVRNLKNYDIERIIIAEASATPTWKAYFMYGIYDLALKYHLRLVDLNYDDAEEVEVPNGRVLRKVYSPVTIRRANVVISVPVLKIWRATGISVNIKNMAGGTLPNYYCPHLCELTQWASKPVFNPDIQYGQSKTLAAAMVDIVSINRAHACVVDALTIMHSSAPDRSFSFKYEDVKVEEFGAIISGRDIVATDAVAAEIMGFNHKKIIHLNFADERGLGTNELKEIQIMGPSIESIGMTCTPMSDAQEIVRARLGSNLN